MAMKLGDAYVLLGLKKDGLKKGLDSAKKETQKAAGGMGSLFKVALGGVIAGAVVMGVKKIVGGIKDMVIEAAGVEKVAQTFDKLTASVGGNAVQALDQLRAATRGMVSDADAMAAGNKFLAMGLANTTEEAAKLAEMGSQLGMAMGSEATESMEQFALMLANQSIPRMDTFGMSGAKARVRINQLMQETKGLTREQAFLQAVQEQASATMAKVGEQSGGAAGAMARLRAVMTNLKNNVGKGFLSVFANVLNTIAGIGQRLAPTIQTIAKGLGAIGNEAFNVLKTLVKGVATSMGVDFDQLAKDSEKWGGNIVLMLAQGIANAIGYVLTALTKLGRAIAGKLRPGSAPRLLPDLKKWGAGAAATYMEGWGEADVSVFSKLSNVIGGYLRGLPEKVMAKERVNPWLASLNAAIAQTISGVDQLGGVNRDLFDDLLASAKFLPESMRTYARSLLDVEIAQGGVGRAMERLEQATEDVAGAQADLNRVTSQYDEMLAPLNAQMQEIEDKRQAIRDQQRLGELQAKLKDAQATDADKELARLEMQEIALRQQMDAVEDERDVAVDAAQEKLNAAELAQQAAQKGVDLAEAAVQAAQKQVAVQERLIGIQTEANQLLGQQASLMESLAASVGGLGPAIADSVTGAMDDVETTLTTDLADVLLKGIEAAFSPLEGMIKELTGVWGGIFAEETGGIVWDVDASAVQPWESATDDVEPKITTFGDTVKRVLGVVGDEIKEIIGGWGSSIIDSMASEENAKRIAEWAQDVGKRMVEGVKKSVAEEGGLGKIIWEALKPPETREKKTFAEAFKEQWAKGWGGKKESEPVGKDLMAGLEDGIEAGWPTTKQALEEKARLLSAVVAQETESESPSRVFEAIGTDLMAGLQLGIEAGGLLVKTAIATWLTDLLDVTFTEGWEAIVDQFVLWWDQYKLDWTAFLDAVKLEALIKWGLILLDADAIWLLIKDAVVLKWTEMKAGIATKLGEIKADIETAWGGPEGILAYLGAIDLYPIGQAIMQGFRDGMADKFAGLKAAAEAWAASIVDIYRQAAGVHSPSTVFRDIGRNLMEGLQQGLEQGHQAVVQTTETQAAQMVGAPAGGVAQMIGAGGGGTDVGAVVRAIAASTQAIVAALGRGELSPLEITLVDEGGRRGRVSTRMARTGKQSVNLALDMAVAGV